MTINIFDASDDAQLILDAVLESGVAGIHGGRVAVRGKLRQVADLAESGGYESIMAHSTIDHPDTELAYPYDESRFTSAAASDAVREAYDATNP